MSKIKVNRLENTATADGGLDIDSSGNISAGGTVTTGGVLSVNRTTSGDGCFHAKLNGTTKASIASDGSATFTGAVTSTTTAKAWVNFNGTGTVAIRASHNVGSITDNGTGSYTVTFTTAMTDANYVCVVNASREDDVLNLNPPAGVDRLASSVRIDNEAASGSQFDAELNDVVIFR